MGAGSGMGENGVGRTAADKVTRVETMARNGTTWTQTSVAGEQTERDRD